MRAVNACVLWPVFETNGISKTLARQTRPLRGGWQRKIEMQDPEGGAVVICNSSGDGETKALPLIIKAVAGNESANDLKQWMKDNKDWLGKKMLEHGE